MARRADIAEAMSHPVRGAWIEIHIEVLYKIDKVLSHPVRGAWIEMCGDIRRRWRRLPSS